jgi:hypothetical protein
MKLLTKFERKCGNGVFFSMKAITSEKFEESISPVKCPIKNCNVSL